LRFQTFRQRYLLDSLKYSFKVDPKTQEIALEGLQNVGPGYATGYDRAFFKKLKLLGLSLNEGIFPTQLRVPKDHAVLTFDKMQCRNCERTRETTQMQLFQQGWLFTNARKGPAHLKILLHYWGKQRAYPLQKIHMNSHMWFHVKSCDNMWNYVILCEI
jgi:hypothetical protein